MTGMPSFGGSRQFGLCVDIVAYVMKVPTCRRKRRVKASISHLKWIRAKKSWYITDKGIGPIKTLPWDPSIKSYPQPDQKYSIVPVPPATCLMHR